MAPNTVNLANNKYVCNILINEIKGYCIGTMTHSYGKNLTNHCEFGRTFRLESFYEDKG